METTKTCRVCDEAKPLDAFSPRNSSRDGRDGRCKSCSTIYHQARYTRDPQRGWIERALIGARQRARERGLEYALSANDVVVPSYCPVLGVPLVFGNPVGDRDNSPSLDRIYNDRGYVADNVIVTSWRANRLKNNATVHELVRIAQFYQQLCL